MRFTGAMLLVVCWVLLASLPAQAKTNWVAADTNGLWFPVGEELVYKGYWGLLSVGEARLWTEWVEEDGRRLLAIKFVAQSSRVISTVFAVNDNLESIVDPETFLPVRFTQRIREGKKVRDDAIVFDHKAGTATCKTVRADKERAPKTVEIEADTRDVLSFMYFMRSGGIKVGTTNTCRILFDAKMYSVTVAGREHEDVYLSHFGEVRCLELEPKAMFGEVFVRKGSLNMWISDDERCICTKAMAIVPVANVKMILQSVKGPGDDFWTSGKRKRK